MIRGEGETSKQIQGFAKRLFASFVMACILVATGYIGFAQVSAAASPSRILMYQGRLLNSNNVPVSDATASISFALYTAASGGTCLWSNNDTACGSVAARTVTLTSGLFSEALGDTAASVPYAAIAATVFANNASVFLEVIVNGETLTPRKQMLAAPFAVNSDVLDGYDTSLIGSTTSVVTVTDANGNLTLTGSPQGSGVLQGSLSINPATGVVAANEVLFGIAVSDSSRFTIDAEGDGVFLGDVAVNGNDITSTGILRLTSGGAAGLTFDAASGIVSVAASDDFAVGGTALASPFSIDESANEVRIGDAANDANDPKITFYASDASNSGTLSFADTDTFTFSNAKISGSYTFAQDTIGDDEFHTMLNSTTITGTSPSSAHQTIVSSGATVLYSGAVGGGGASNTIKAVSGTLEIDSASAVINRGFGIFGTAVNHSTSATAIDATGFIAGGFFEVLHDAAQAISLAYGSFSTVQSIDAGGTITTGVAVGGEVTTGDGAFTTSYGGRFLNTQEGTTRYGVYGEASGGATANFSGYFAGGRLQVDANDTPDTPGLATGAGDLFVSNSIENDGDIRFGDTSGTDEFLFTSAATTEDVTQINVASLTSGTGLTIARADDGGAGVFSGTLLDLQMLDTTSSTGIGLNILNSVAGSSAAVVLTQDNVANQTDAAGGTTSGGQALIIQTPEVGSNDDIVLIRSNNQIVLAIETDGSVLSDNAFSSAGADYAEYFPSTDSTLSSYEMVCVDSTRPLSVKRCGAGELDPFGVISSDPGFIGNLPRVGETGNVLVGMVGQIETHVNANEGAIAIGDPITTSALNAGYGAKALGPARIIGFALESLSSGTGNIKVLVQPQWYAGNVFTRDGSATKVAGSLAIAALTSATSSNAAVNSADLQFRGSVWNGGAATTRAMSLQTTVTAANDYRLSVKNNEGLEVASVNRSGDLALAGKFYPSDRGAVQGSAYIYFDGSAGIGGSFMRTNASGWATGSYDFAEMFPSADALQPGEVVVFGDADEHVKRSTGEAYSRTIVGIVSTRPGFLAGENRAGSYPIALAGRVPTFVSTENGEIRIGDPLTTSSTPGYAMRATEPGPIIGYASEAFSGTAGSIVVFVNASYYAGTPVEEGPATSNTVSHLAQDIENFDTTGALNFNGGQLLSIGSMVSASGAWRLDTNGDIVTSGRLIELVESSTGAIIETYAATSREMTVQLSGTVRLDHGRASVRFDEIDSVFRSIVDEHPSYRAFVTPYGATGMLHVTNRTAEGFDIVESGDATSGVDVDWIVIAYRRDFVPAVQVTSPTLSSGSSSASQPVLEVMTDAGEVVSLEDETTSIQEELTDPDGDILDSGVSVLVDGDGTSVEESVEVSEPTETPDAEAIVTPEVESESVSEPTVAEAAPVEAPASTVSTP